jgi:hypothetical protein
MVLGIHQPQYLPWLPYFLKAAEADVFILLDSVDFQKNGLQNRNQIKTAQGPLWLTVPVKQRLGQTIGDVQVDNTANWRRKHWQTIQQSYRKAAAFEAHAADLEQLYSQEWASLNELNTRVFMLMLRWLGLERPIMRSSQMEAKGRGSELVLNLCREAGATRYISGTGGHNYLDERAFQDAGIDVVYRPPVLPGPYPQQYPQAGFLNSLSALDVILNCGAAWRTFVPDGPGGA